MCIKNAGACSFIDDLRVVQDIDNIRKKTEIATVTYPRTADYAQNISIERLYSKQVDNMTLNK